ncbi:MAG: hypothetical protein MUO26_10095 [Methanotrichaceae archaeon]|nr:hypothetical protein [Methanotrichaceae archaeon]
MIKPAISEWWIQIETWTPVEVGNSHDDVMRWNSYNGSMLLSTALEKI